MLKFQCLLLVFKQLCFRYLITCMTVPLNFKHSKKREGEMAIKIEQMQTRRGGGGFQILGIL